MNGRKRIIKTPLIIMMVFMLTITSVLPVQAKGKVKLKNSKVTLTVGQSKTLKVLNTKKKVKWTTSNKKVATVSKKGKVKAKKKGTCKIYARVGKKKLTCKVTVKPKKKVKKNTAANKNTTSNNVTWKSYGTDRGVVILVKNNYSYMVGVEVDCLFYDSKGKLLEKSSDSNYALEAGRECALFAWNADANWSSHKINLKISNASNVISNVSGIKGSYSTGNENVMVEVKNTGKKVFSTQIAIVFYKNGKVVGYGTGYADVNNKGDTDYLEIPFPYDSNYKTIYPDKYVVYVNHSYTYTWMN